MAVNISKYFVKPDDSVLNRVTKPIKKDQIHSTSIKNQIKKMLDVAYGEQQDRDKPVLVGLAAPQIGISARIILVDIKADGRGDSGDLRVFINPRITYSSKKETEWYEGCFSTDCVCGIVSRPDRIKIEAYNTKGELAKAEYSGYTARIFQHEIDHLDGKEFTTHIVDDSKLHWVEDEEFPQYRNNEGWRNWPNKCPRSKWEKIKGIK